MSIHFDGSAAAPNPGNACFAFVHTENGIEKHFECGFIGKETNNMAEYYALFRALVYCKISDISGIEIFGDSKLVINQVNGVWKIKSESLKSLHEKCKRLCQEMKITLKWISRDDNQRADFLSKLPIEAIQSTQKNPCISNGFLEI